MQEILEKINQWDFGNLGPSFVAGFESRILQMTFKMPTEVQDV
jgi:hypothetical protein